MTALNGAQDGAQGEAEAPVQASLQERLEALRLAVAMVGQVRPQDVLAVLEAAEHIRRWLSYQ